jgi:hypothetical protein
MFVSAMMAREEDLKKGGKTEQASEWIETKWIDF